MSESASVGPVVVLVYSDDRSVRDRLRLAMGRRVASDLPEITVIDTATQPAVLSALDAGGIDLAIFDGEASPAGGLGLCRQVKDEVADCPPVLVVVGRRQDAWLASWSRADEVAAHPIDPVSFPELVARQLRAHLDRTPA